jgi:signal transduction histidine kinase
MRPTIFGAVSLSFCRGAWTLDPDQALLHRETFTQTRLFCAVCMAAVIGVLWGCHRIRVRQMRGEIRRTIEARFIERERIAGELHDTLLQGIQGLILRFQAATDRIPRGESARDLMERALERADQVLEESRGRVKELRALNGGPGPLSEALTETAQPLSDAHSIPFSVTVEGTARPLHPIVREEAYLIASEAIINAFRHPEASKIEIRLIYDPAAFQVSVNHDGRGTEREPISAGAMPENWEPQGMRERARRIRGLLTIRGDARTGTEVHLRLPAEMAYQSPIPSKKSWWRNLVRLSGGGPASGTHPEP